MTEIQIECAGAGHVQITDEVIAVIAETAAMEIEGVVGIAGILGGDISQILGRRNLSKGVSVKMEDGAVSVSLNLLVKFGYHIQEVSVSVQKKVKAAIENMTGLNAAQINISVTGVLHDSKESKGRQPERQER